MKIGIFAGTFNPVHSGHIEFAKTAVKETSLDKVIIVAEKEPYRKKLTTSWNHRQAMIERATESIDQVDHDYQFASLLARQHTMKDMLTVAKHHYGDDNEYWFLVGSDIFEHIHLWHDFAKKHEYGGFVVALRSDHTLQWVEQQKQKLESSVGEIKMLIITNPKPHISSSKIRHLIANSEEPGDVSPEVLVYIQTHHLYIN